MRAISLPEHFLVQGPEFSQGIMTPGGFYYYFLFLLHQILGTAENVYLGLSLLTITGFVLVFLALRKSLNSAYAIFATGTVALSVLSGTVIIQFWNPSFTFVFACSGFYLLILYLKEKKNWAYPFCIALYALAAQIHFSFIYAIVIALIAPIVLGRQLSLRLWLISFSVIIFAYSPYFFDLINRYSEFFGQFHQFIEYKQFKSENFSLISKLANSLDGFFTATFGVSLVIYHDIVLNVLNFSEIGNSTRRIIRDAISVILPTIFIVYFFYVVTSIVRQALSRPGAGDELSDANKLVAFVYFSFLAAIVLHASLIGTFANRYAIWFIPFACFAIGCGLRDVTQAVVDRLSGSLRTMSQCLIALLAILIVGLGAYRSFNSERWMDGELLHADLIEVVNTAANELGMPKQDLTTKITIFRYNTKELTERIGGSVGWTPYGYYSSADYIRKVIGASTGRLFSDCLLAFQNPPAGFSEPVNELIKRILLESGFSPNVRSIEKLVRKDRFTYFRLVPEGVNCPRNVNNNYIPTADESSAERILAEIMLDRSAVKTDVIEVLEERGRREFLVLFGETVSISAIILLESEKRNVTALVQSRDLRGFNGTKSFQFKNPRLEFREVGSSNVSILQIYRGLFGGNYNPVGLVFPPWKTKKLYLGSGVYEVVFVADDYREFSKDNWIGNVRVGLTTNFHIN